jgi:hypothetical protein
MNYKEMLNLKLLNEVHTLAKHMQQKYPHWREGQCLMNALHEIDADCFRAITTTEADCFYVDEKIQNFWDAVAYSKQ